MFSLSILQHVLFIRGGEAVFMADHLNARSSALHTEECQDRPPSGSDEILAAFQSEKLLSLRLTLSQTGAKDLRD